MTHKWRTYRSVGEASRQPTQERGVGYNAIMSTLALYLWYIRPGATALELPEQSGVKEGTRYCVFCCRRGAVVTWSQVNRAAMWKLLRARLSKKTSRTLSKRTISRIYHYTTFIAWPQVSVRTSVEAVALTFVRTGGVVSTVGAAGPRPKQQSHLLQRSLNLLQMV